MSTTVKSLLAARPFLAAASLFGAMVLFSGATEERLNIRSPEPACPAFAWPNSYTACLDDGVRPSGSLKHVDFADATAALPEPSAFQ
jgi:hypothetical protein